jgi:formylglycine-generating enzyme required for sulfatase activity
MKSKLFIGTLIVLATTFVSTLGIFASDTLRGIDGGIASLSSHETGVCPKGMVAQKINDGLMCVDEYEATPAESCPHTTPSNVFETEKNASTKECYAASVPGKAPWTFVTLSQAQRVCAEGGKRLPTSDEWFQIALGTDAALCTIHKSSPNETGTNECRSSSGAYDTIGNVWEWVNETVEGNGFHNRNLPDEGYVTSADASGVAITTHTESADVLYGEDYFWSKSEGIFGMIRGGFYGSEEDAGLYTVNATVATNFASQGVGFRCVRDII